MFEPITFPMAMSLFFLSAATTEVINSGSEVPMATMVSPIIFWLTPSKVAILIELSTTSLPPATSPASPINYEHPYFQGSHLFQIFFARIQVCRISFVCICNTGTRQKMRVKLHHRCAKERWRPSLENHWSTQTKPPQPVSETGISLPGRIRMNRDGIN
jgi:hypothetical protein